MAYGSTRDIIVSTTPQLEGWEIQEYLGPVSSHLVAGTNIFSDIAASWSDVFGGRSKSYRKQLEKINDEVIGELKDEAADRRADALIGLRIDHDQISGQGKEMFMVTASATAVRAASVQAKSDSAGQKKGGGPLPVQQMKMEMQKEELLEEHRNGQLELNSDRWQFLIENRITEFAVPARHTAQKIRARLRLSDTQKEHLGQCRHYFLSIPEETAKDQLYEMASHENSRIAHWGVDVLEEGNMLDFDRIGSMLDGDFHDEKKPALEILARVDKPYFEEADLRRLKNIGDQIKSGFGKRGEVKEIEESGMLSSGSKEVWQIEGGPENPMDREYCQETGLDIYGFEKGETRPNEVIEILDRKIKVLERQFSG